MLSESHNFTPRGSLASWWVLREEKMYEENHPNKTLQKLTIYHTISHTILLPIPKSAPFPIAFFGWRFFPGGPAMSSG